jgi:hypothetical protein
MSKLRMSLSLSPQVGDPSILEEKIEEKKEDANANAVESTPPVDDKLIEAVQKAVQLSTEIVLQQKVCYIYLAIL